MSKPLTLRDVLNWIQEQDPELLDSQVYIADCFEEYSSPMPLEYISVKTHNTYKGDHLDDNTVILNDYF